MRGLAALKLKLKRRTVVSTTILTAVALVATTLAVLYQGFTKPDLDLNDGGVWVTASSELMVGHLNHPSRVIDSYARTTSPTADLLQDGDGVLLVDQGQGVLNVVDPARSELVGAGRFTPHSALAFRHEMLGLIDAANHGLYAASLQGVQGLSVEGQDPLAELGAGSDVAVTADGTVLALGRKGELVTLAALGADPAITDFTEFPANALLQLTAVGETAVAYDTANGVLHTADRSIPVAAGKGGRLQQAGPAADAVVIATRTALVVQPLDGGEPSVTAVPDGDPSEPVWLAGCAYAVWSVSGQYVRDCLGEADDRNDVVPDHLGRTELVLRQNRNVVVVNDVASGTVWLISQDMQKVDNWKDVLPPPSIEEEDEESQDPDQQFTMPEREKENHPPNAENDNYGVRAGLTTVLPVLDNDTDPDGDLLIASLVGEAPAFTTVTPIRGGAALQVEVNPNASGTLSFSYQASDGRPAGTDRATVTLTVLTDEGDNRPPQQKPNQRALVAEVGATITYDVLPGWVDPDGDDIYLKRAWSDDEDRVSFRSNGVIEFTDALREEGVRTVNLLVTDGRKEQQGTLTVLVKPKGSQQPVPNADRYSATAGVPITLTPLTNDLSPSGSALQLANFQLDTGAGVTVTPDYKAGTLIFQATNPGTYYLQYLVSNGPSAATGLIRVDVVARDPDGLDPIAGRDTALVPERREVLVDMLANDIDPAGGILVVQSVSVPEAAQAISAEVLEHRILRIRDVGGLTTPVTISYTVSNGLRSATGEVRVLAVDLPDKLQAPVAVADRAVVRAGDVVTMDVLANDYHPDGDTIELMPELAEAPPASAGEMFVAEGRLRFRAGDEPGTVRAVYRVVDSQLNVNSATVTIQVFAPDEGSNSAPRPLPVTARALQGSMVRIPIPIDGIDPDGDSVELVGTGTAPKLGRVLVGDAWLEYEAYPDAVGMDSFEYVVRDRNGASATGSIVVGIAVPAAQNQAPYTATDEVVVKPGRRVSAPVLVNDSDPDGDDIGLLAELASVPEGVSAEVVKDRVLVQAPQTEASYPIGYTAVDVFGATAAGDLIVTVDADAEGRTPIARDDRVQPATLGDGASIEVAVLENDEDPDGVVDDLTLSSEDPGVEVLTNDRLRIELTPQARIVLYSITDLDGMTGSAFVFVPGTETLLPALRVIEPIEVVAGETVEVPLAEYVAVRPGREPRLAVADIETAHAEATGVDGAGTTLTYTAAADYHGPDAMGVQVTDGTGPDDPEGLTAHLSIPVIVVPAENQPPALRNTSVRVEPGGDPVEVNLRRLASDPDRGDVDQLSYAVADAPSGIRASVSGYVLSVAAEPGVEENSVAGVRVRVTDPQRAEGEGTVSVQVTSSLRELPTVTNDYIDRADQGVAESYDVLANDGNPFRAEGKPLTIVDASRLSGDPGAEVSHDGQRITVKPSADFHGTIVISYTIQDAMAIPERQAEGTLTVVVQGRPDRVARPLVNSVGDEEAVLSWTPPAHNGRPITGYTVTSVSGPKFSKECSTTTCTLSGLSNNKEYRFAVMATNEVGVSDPSPPSAIARPDVIPDTPDAPTLTFGDRSLDIDWDKPASRGSPVSSYILRISPAAPNGRTEQIVQGGSSFVWEGLTNGQAYQLQVQAHNLAGGSEWSQFSAPEVPAREPEPPGRPTTTPSRPVGSQAQIAVSWAPPESDNGDRVADYTLTVRRGGETVRTVRGISGTSQNVTVDTNSTPYTFTVTARNKAGSSDPSPASAPRQAANPPGAPTELSIEPGDRRVTVGFTRGALNGNSAGQLTWRYRVSPGGATGTLPEGGAITGLTNGTSYRVEIWATSDVEGVEPGDSATTGAAVPFGRPIVTLQGIDSLDNAVRFRWSVNDNGRPITDASPNNDGTYTRTGLAPSQSYTLEASFTNAAGTTTESWTGRANPPPAPTSWTVVPTVDTCPEDRQGSNHFGGPGNCSSPGGFIDRGTNITVNCYADWGTAINYRYWFRMTNTLPGWYVAAGTTNTGDSPVSGMPHC